MILDLSVDTLILRASPRLKELIATIPGWRFSGMDGDMGVWTADAAWAVAVATRAVLGDEMQVTEAASDWAWSVRASIELSYGLKAGQEYLNLNPGLLGFQRVGVHYLALRERVLLADEMGTGKTVQSASAIEALAGLTGSRPTPYPVLVVCTNSMKSAWKHHLEEWAGLDVAVAGDTKKARLDAIKEVAEGRAQALVIHWDALRLHSRLAGYGSVALTEDERTPKELNAIRWSTVIADEAHKAKDPKAKQTRALKAVAQGATYRWALTGTPITGKIEDLWSVLNFVAPTEFPSKTRFIDRYALAGMNAYGGFETYGLNPHTEGELKALIQPFLLRRLKAEVLPQLPPVYVSRRLTQLGTKQAAAYRLMEKEMLYVDDEGRVLVSTDPVVRYGRLSQIAAATPVLEPFETVDKEGNPIVVQRVVKFTMPSTKVDAIFDLLDEGDDPIVVGAESRKLLELLAEQLDKHNDLKANKNNQYPYVMITGTQSATERAGAVDLFQRGGARLALVSLGAGAEGITLTRARRLVFMQASYESVKNDQFAARIHRIGQEADSVEVIYLLTANTVDMDRPAAAEEKRELARRVLDVPV